LALGRFNRDAVKCHCQEHSSPDTLDILVEMKAMSYIYSLPLSTAFGGRDLSAIALDHRSKNIVIFITSR
jgi:hypothetical protein